MSKRTGKRKMPLVSGSAENIKSDPENEIGKSRLEASQEQNTKELITLKQQVPYIISMSKRTDKKNKPLVISSAGKIKLEQEKKIAQCRLEASQEQKSKELITLKQRVPIALNVQILKELHFSKTYDIKYLAILIFLH